MALGPSYSLLRIFALLRAPPDAQCAPRQPANAVQVCQSLFGQSQSARRRRVARRAYEEQANDSGAGFKWAG